MSLSISGGNGNPASQASTQSPQTSTGSNAPAAASSGKVQPGTASSLLAQSGGGSGVSLSSQPLTVVSLNSGVQTQTASQTAAHPAKQTPPPKHHLNPVLFVLVVGLVLLAAIFFWITARSAKNTTDY